MGLDIREMWQRANLWLTEFTNALDNVREELSYTKLPASSQKIAPRELIVTMEWLRLFAEYNSGRLGQGQPLTESDLTRTLRG